MDYMKFLNASEEAADRQYLIGGYADQETPEQAAVRLQKARVFDVEPTVVEAITPEEEAERKASLVDLAAMREQAPVLTENLRNPTFLNLVKDNLTTQTLLETTIWKLAPEAGKPEGLWESARASGARGAYSFFSGAGELRDTSAVLFDILDKEKRIAAGESDADIFGTESDPSGTLGRTLFDKTKDQQKFALNGALQQAAERTAWMRRMQSFFPQSEEMQRFSQAEGFTDSVKALAENPLDVLANVGPESLTQFAPSLVALGLLGPAGAGAQMAGTGAASFALDKQASFVENLVKAGVNLDDPASVVAFFSNPENRDAIVAADENASLHATGTAIFDALSGGLASRTLLPKPIREFFPEGSASQALVNTAVQMPVQGTLGGAGEAAGQLLSDGEITSWSDIVAEFAGEHFTAPLEVAAATAHVFAENAAQKAKAEANVQAAQRFSELKQSDQTTQLDPESVDSLHAQAAERAQVDTVYVDAQALHQTGLDQKFGTVKEIAQQIESAMATGGQVGIPFATYAREIAPNDDGTFASIAQFGATPSLIDTQAIEEESRQAAAAQFERARKLEPDDFRQSSAEVGKEIGTQLRDLGVTRDEASALQTILQTAVNALAKDMGSLPKEVWEKYGVRFTKAEGIDAQGGYDPVLRAIARGAKADKSTLLHESGHLFLDMRLAAANDIRKAPIDTHAKTRLVEQAGDLMTWFGLKDLDQWNGMTLEEKRGYHEKFARSFEAYVMEGTAPTSGLRKAFRQFARWLRTIYRFLTKIPGQAIDDDVRSFFDGMFLADSQVREATIRANTSAFFVTQEKSGMSPVEWEEYNQQLENVYEEAVAEQTGRVERLQSAIASRRRRLVNEIRKKSNAAAEAIRGEVTKELKKTKVYNAWSVLRDGATVTVDGVTKEVKVKLFYGDLKQLGYTRGQIEKLHAARLASKQEFRQPMPLYTLADQLGYANENEMIDDLLNHLDMDKVIDQRVADRMMAEQPELASDQRIRETAEVSLFNDARMKIMQTEINALERMSKAQEKTEARAFEDVAYQLVSQMKFTNLRPIFYARAAQRAERNARRAFAKGDVRDTIFFKRQAIYQAAMAKASKEALMEASKRRKVLSRYRTPNSKSIDPRYYSVMQRALYGMNLYSLDQLGLNPEDKRFGDYLGELIEEDSVPVDISPELLAALNTFKSDFIGTVDGFRQFYDLVSDLAHIGRDRKHISLLKGKADLETFQIAASEQISGNALSRGRKALTEVEREGFRAGLKDAFVKFGLNHARAAQLLEAIEGVEGGQLFDAVIATNQAAADKEAGLKHDFTKRVSAILAPIMSDLVSQKQRTSPTLGAAFTTGEAFFALLNFGNEGNRQRLLHGFAATTSQLHGKEPTEEQMLAFFSEFLSPAHFEAAQRIWDVFARMQEETDKTAKKLIGRSPKWVQPSAFEAIANDGTKIVMKGGYYPIVYDRKATSSGEQIAQAQTAKDMAPVFGKEGVDDGHLKTRVAQLTEPRPLALTSRALFEGLESQIHYASYAPWVNDMRKVFGKGSKVDTAIRTYWGAEYCNVVTRWVNDCRNGNAGQATPIDTVANVLRRNISLAGIGFNLMTAAIQPVGVLQSVVRIGGRWCGKGIAEYLRMGPVDATAWVAQKSPMMADRGRTQFRELTEIQSQIGGTGKVKEAFMRAAYKPIVFMQLLVDVPTWLGAYQKALYNGFDDAKAVALADRAVMDAQGSGRMNDLSEMERGGAWSKLFTVFYTFFNTALNLAALSGHTKSTMKAAADIAMLCVMQPVIETFLRASLEGLGGGDDDDDPDYWLNMMKKSGTGILDFNLGLFVGLRELSGVLGEYQNYSGPSGVRKVQDIRTLITKLQADEYDEATLRAAINALGAVTGLPAAAINRVIKAANDEKAGPSAYFLGF